MRHTADSTAATTGRRTLTLPPQPIQVEAAPAPLPSDHLLQGRRTIEIQINRVASQRGRPRNRQLARFQCFIVGRLPGLSQARQGLFCQPTGLPPRSQAFFAPRSCMPRSTKKPVYGPVFYDSHDNFGLKPFIYKRKQLLN